MTEHDIYGLSYMTKWFAFQFGFIHVLLYVCFRIFYDCFTNYALCMIKLFMFYALWPFLCCQMGSEKWVF